jgi:hypothetical protein
MAGKGDSNRFQNPYHNFVCTAITDATVRELGASWIVSLSPPLAPPYETEQILFCPESTRKRLRVPQSFTTLM